MLPSNFDSHSTRKSASPEPHLPIGTGKRRKTDPTDPSEHTSKKTDEVKKQKMHAESTHPVNKSPAPLHERNSRVSHDKSPADSTVKKKLKKSLEKTLKVPTMEKFANTNYKDQHLQKRNINIEVDKSPYEGAKKRQVITNGSVLLENLSPFDLRSAEKEGPIEFLFALLRDMDQSNIAHHTARLQNPQDLNEKMIEKHAQARILLYYFLSQMFSGTDSEIDIMNTSLQIWKGREAHNTDGCHHSYVPSIQDNALELLKKNLIDNLIQTKEGSTLDGYNILLLLGLGVDFSDIASLYHALEKAGAEVDSKMLAKEEVEKLWEKHQLYNPKTLNDNTAFHYLNNHTLVAPKLVNYVDDVLERFLRQYSLKVLNDASQYGKNLLNEEQIQMVTPLKMTEVIASETTRLLSFMEEETKGFVNALQEINKFDKEFAEKQKPKFEEGLGFTQLSRKIDYLQSFYDSFENFKQALEKFESLTNAAQCDVNKADKLKEPTTQRDISKSPTQKWVDLLEQTRFDDQFKTYLEGILADRKAIITAFEEKNSKPLQEIEDIKLWIQILEAPLSEGLTTEQKDWKKAGEAQGFNRKEKYTGLTGALKTIHDNWQKAVTREELVAKSKSKDPKKIQEALSKQKTWFESYNKKLEKAQELQESKSREGQIKAPEILNEKVKLAIKYVNDFIDSYGNQLNAWSNSTDPKPIWVENPNYFSNIMKILHAQKKGTAAVTKLLNEYHRDNKGLSPEEARVIFFSRTLNPYLI